MDLTLEIPGPLAACLEDEAARRGTSAEELVLTALTERYASHTETVASEDALDGFVGSVDSGDPTWASVHTDELRSRTGL